MNGINNMLHKTGNETIASYKNIGRYAYFSKIVDSLKDAPEVQTNISVLLVKDTDTVEHSSPLLQIIRQPSGQSRTVLSSTTFDENGTALRTYLDLIVGTDGKIGLRVFSPYTNSFHYIYQDE